MDHQGEERQLETTTVEVGTESSSHIPLLRSVFGGYRLHPKTWNPTGAAKALVYVCHGVGEHMGRYEELGSYLCESDILVFGHDHVGHGQSEGDRVHIEDIDTYVQDVIHHVELMKNKYPHLPCILMGHSMGGLVAAHVVIQRSDLFTSAILSSSAAEFEAKFSIWIVMKAFELVGHVTPQLGVRTLDTNDISSIPEEVERYVNDPLNWHGALKARWGVAMIKSITLLRENVGRIFLPLLFIHGSDDNIVPITSSYFLHDNVSSQKKRFEVFEGSRHETLHDKEQERARKLIKDWILNHLSTASVSLAQSEVKEPPSALGGQESSEEPLQSEQQSTSECTQLSQQTATEDQENL